MSLQKLCRCSLKLRSSSLQIFNLETRSAKCFGPSTWSTRQLRFKSCQGYCNIITWNRRDKPPMTSSFSTDSGKQELSEGMFDQLCADTLDRLGESLEELGDRLDVNPDFDVALADGVLTLKLGGSSGTYVINKQTPNRQIWLSSPTSGPKRYDYVDGTWIYKRDGKSLQNLLKEELSVIYNTDVQLNHTS